MKRYSKLISLLLAVCMVVSMLPTFAAAEDSPVEDIADVSVINETESVPTAEPIEVAPAEQTAPAAELQDDDAAHVAAGEFAKTVDPDGAVAYYSDLSAATTVASSWTKTGGTLYLLSDYTIVNSANTVGCLLTYAGNNSYATTEDGITVSGFWFDLGGHTLTAKIGQGLLGRLDAGSVNIRNGRIIYQNNGRQSNYVGVVTLGLSSTSPVSGSTVLTSRVTLKDAEIISLKKAAGNVIQCVNSTVWNNEVRLYDSKLIAEETHAIKFCKSNATVTGAGLAALQSAGAVSKVQLFGKSVVGTLAGFASILYTKTGDGTTEGIAHSVEITTDPDSLFLGSEVYSNESTLPVASSVPTMEKATYNFAPPDAGTIAETTTLGAVPTDKVSADYAALKYPEQKDDEQLIAEGKFIKAITPDGVTVGYNTLPDAFSAAADWNIAGGKLVLLQDYTLIYSTSNSGATLLTAPTNSYENDEEPDMPVQGYWFDLNGHTLTVTAGRALMFSGDAARINIKNGRIIYRNSGRTAAYYGAIAIGASAPSTLAADGEVTRPVVNLKNAQFYTLHWSKSNGSDTKITPVFYTSCYAAEINLRDSVMISEDAQAIKLYKSSTQPTAEQKAIMREKGVGYDVSLYGTSVLGSLADTAAITLQDPGADTGLSFNLNVTLAETTRILGSDVYSGTLKSELTPNLVTVAGDLLNMVPTTYNLTLPDGETIAASTTVGAKPEDLVSTTIPALMHTPITENDIASYITPTGAEGAVSTLADALAAWKTAGFKGTIKLYGDPTKDDLTGADRVFGGRISFATTSTVATAKKADILLNSAANGGELTLDLNGHTLQTDKVFFATDATLNGFALTIRNGKLISSDSAALLLNGTAIGVTMEDAELQVSSGGYCVYDYRTDHSWLILRRCKMTGASGGAIYVLTNAANVSDSSLLYYIADCDLEYTDTAAAGRPIAHATNAPGKAYRSYTMIFDGDNTFVTTYKDTNGIPYATGTAAQQSWSNFLGGTLVTPDGSTAAPWTITTDVSTTLLTTEDAAAATLEAGEMAFHFKDAADAIRYAAYFGRAFTDTTVFLKNDVTLSATLACNAAEYESAFTVDLGGYTLSGAGTSALFTLTGTTDVVFRNGAIRNGEAAVLTGATTYTYENCSVNSDQAFVLASNKAFDAASATYATVATGETIYFASAADAIVYSQTDPDATAEAGGQITLLSDFTADGSFGYQADETCVFRLDKNAKAINIDLSGHAFKIPGTFCIGSDEAFGQKLSVSVANGTWEQTTLGAAAFRVEGTAPLFNLHLDSVTLISAGAGISYFAAGDSAENMLLVTESTIIANRNGLETLNGNMTGRIGGRIIVADSAIAAVNRDNGYAIVDGVSSADEASHILLVGSKIALYSTKSDCKPVKISEEEGDFCAAPQYKVVLEEAQSQLFSGERVKEENYVNEALGGKQYDAMTRWTPNTIASYLSGNGELTFFSTMTALKAAYAADNVGGGTITLITDVTTSETFVVDKDLTIDLGGFTLTASNADTIRVEAGKSLTVENGKVHSTKTAIVDNGILIMDDVEILGANALKIDGSSAATVSASNSRFYALDTDGLALNAAAAEGTTVKLDNVVLAAPYTNAPLQIADGNTVEFSTAPVIYTKQGNNAAAFTVAGNGKLIVPDDLVVALLSKKVSYEIDGTTYTVSSFGFATVNVTFKQDGASLYSTSIYSGTAPDYNETPKKVSLNNITYLFVGWEIEDGDGTLYQIGQLPILFEETVFTAVFEETQHLATVTLNNEIFFYDDMDTAFISVDDGAVLKLWRDVELAAPWTIHIGNFTFDLGGFTITATETAYAIALQADKVTLQNGKVISTGEAVRISGKGNVLQDLRLHSASVALLADGCDVQINDVTAVGGSEALYAQNAAAVSAYESDFYSTDGYALTAKDAGTKVSFTGGNKIGSAKNGQSVLQIIGGASVETADDTFYVTQQLQDAGKWYECDKQSEFSLQSASVERTPTNVLIVNDANNYKSTSEFYAVNTEAAAVTLNGVAYSTLAEALTAAGAMNDSTIVLLRDINAADEHKLSYSITKNMTLDLNGHTFVGMDNYASTSANYFITFTPGTTVTIQNGTIIAPNTSKNASNANVYNLCAPPNGMTLKLNNLNLFTKNAGIYTTTGQKNFTLEINGGVFVNYGDNYPINFNFSGDGKNASLKISGGAVFIASGSKSVINQQSTTKALMNIEDVYTYSTSSGYHIPEPAPNENNILPEPVLLNAAASPVTWLNEQFADLLVKYGSILDFSGISETSKLMHYVSSANVAEFDGISYGSLTDALAMAASSGEDNAVTLLQDTVEYGQGTISENTKLDLNGKELSFGDNSDLTVFGQIKPNGGKLLSNGNVLFKAGSTDLTGETVEKDYRLDLRLMPEKVSLTLDSGVSVNFKLKNTNLDALGEVSMNGVAVEGNVTRTQTIFSRAFDFDDFSTEIELTSVDSSGTLHRSGYKTGVKTFADGVANDDTATAAFKSAMSALSLFGGSLNAAHNWTKAKDFSNIAGCAVYVDPNRAFDLKFTGTAGSTLTVTYADSIGGNQRNQEITLSGDGEAIYTGLYTACLNDSITVTCNGASETFTYADLVKTAVGETALYTNMIAYSNAANALFKS